MKRSIARPAPSGTRLTRAHFAFMRAVLQGLDERVSWDRYMAASDGRADARKIRAAIAAMRDAFAVEARRQRRHGLARLVKMDATQFAAAPPSSHGPAAPAPQALPSPSSAPIPAFEDYVASRGDLAEFSLDEQIEHYDDHVAQLKRDAAALGPVAKPSRIAQLESRRAARRVQLIEHQVEALHWLEAQVVRDPHPGAAVEAWLPPLIAARLAEHGLDTIRELHAHIELHGYHWFRKIPGIGRGKAQRVVQWIQANAQAMQLVVSEHVLHPPALLPASARARATSPAADIVPLERLIIPAKLGGEQSLAAIRNWVEKIESPATRRAYRLIAERLVLWAVLVRSSPVHALESADLQAWGDFLRAPPERWLGSRAAKRWSPLWRPLERGLSDTEVGRHQSAAKQFLSGLRGG